MMCDSSIDSRMCDSAGGSLPLGESVATRARVTGRLIVSATRAGIGSQADGIRRRCHAIA